MKMKIGRSSNDVRFIDDNGEEVELICAEIDIKLRPAQLTEVRMSIYVDEIELDVPTDQIIAKTFYSPLA